MPDTQYVITEADRSALNRLTAEVLRHAKWIAGLRVTGAKLTNAAEGATIVVSNTPASPSTESDPEFEAIINGHTQDGSNKRWFYGWKSAEETDSAYATTSERTGGASGESTDAEKRAFNRLEDINTTSGMTGVGVNLDNLPDGFDLQPIPDGVPVRMRRTVTTNGKVKFKFSAPNGVDGTCTDSGGGA